MVTSHVHKITDTLDRGTLCVRLGVKPRMIRKVREDRRFPARWYVVVRDMCREAGIACPMEAFNWQLPAEPAADPARPDA